MTQDQRAAGAFSRWMQHRMNARVIRLTPR